MADQYGNLGIVYKIRGDLDKGEEFYLKSLEINESLDRKENMAWAYGNLGLIYRIQGDLSKAKRAWGNSLELFKDVRVKPQIEEIQNLIYGLEN